MSGDAVIIVREERTRIGNIDITKKTALLATSEGVLAYEEHNVQQHQPLPYRAYGAPALLGTTVSPTLTYPAEPEAKGCCDYGCCECDANFPWYHLQGKGCLILLLLLLMYLVFGCVLIPLIILYFLLLCICSLFNNDDN